MNKFKDTLRDSVTFYQKERQFSIDEIYSKKHTTYFLTRIKGALLKSSDNNMCNYGQLSKAMQHLHASYANKANKEDVKKLFEEFGDRIEIDELVSMIDCIKESFSSNQNSYVIYFQTKRYKELKRLPLKYSFEAWNQPQGSKELNEIKEDSEDQMRGKGSFNPQVIKQLLQLEKQDLQFQNKTKYIQKELQPKMITQNQPITQQDKLNKTDYQNFLSMKDFHLDSRSPSPFKVLPKNVSSKNEDEFSLQKTPENSSEQHQKEIRLPRPKNVRNGNQYQFVFQRSQIYFKKQTSDHLTSLDRPNIKKHEQTFRKYQYKLLEEQIGYHHLLSMEKLLTEMEQDGPVNQFAYLSRVRNHLKKIMSEELIIDFINEISVDGICQAAKLQLIQDSYKFGANQSKFNKNDSENYKKKMLSEEITVKKESEVHELYVLLIEKLEEKFIKFQKAYYFFDISDDGKVYFTQFRQTLDKLCIRCSQEEARALFSILDTKKDGHLDYEEFCQLVPNKLELDMLDRNGESLANKTKIIYDKFGEDLENFNKDPFRQNERSRFKCSKLIDPMEDQIGQEIMYSDKLKRAINHNLLIRKRRSQPGQATNLGFKIPSDPNYVYGLRTKKGENMYDIMKNNYGKEWIVEQEDKNKLQAKINELQKEKTRQMRTRDTLANRVRSVHNSGIFSNDSHSPDSRQAITPLKGQDHFTNQRLIFDKTLCMLSKRRSVSEKGGIEFKEEVQSNIGSLLRGISKDYR